MYPSNIKELQLINCVAQDYFNKYDRADIIGNVDFAIKMKRRSQGSKHEEFISQDMDDIYFLWAEAKVAENACEEMLTQLILSAKDAMNRHNCLPPYYLGCFDHKKIAFAPYEDILPLLQDTNNELDWNTPRSDYANSRFKHAVSIIKRRNALRNMAVYHFHQSGDDQNLRLFIAQNFTCGSGGALLKRPITVHDFASIYQNEWKPKVLPSINLSDREWKEYAKNDIHGGDFFLAELMSEHGSAIDLTAKLAVKMVDGKYKEVKTIAGKQYTLDDGITHKNGGTEYERFWNKYQRPPAPSQCEQIIARRDLLLPDEYRERQGAFYTPAKWVRLAHQYIERALGSDWQQRYYIWDCAAGTGNLLCGLKYKDQIFASTLHQADVQVMKAIIREQNSACNMQHDESRKQNAESRVQQSESRRQNTNPSTTTNCIAREHSFGAAQQFSMATEHSAVVSEEIYGATEHSFGVSEELSMASEHSVGLSQEFSMASEHSVGMPQEFSTASEHSVGEAQELSNATDSTEHKTMSKNILPLLEGNVFEFDFLNDPLDDPKIPHLLRQILHNKGTLNGKQLLILINPPYAEHGNRRMVSNPTERNKSEVATAHKLHDSLAKKIGGQAARELFAMFLARIKDEIPLAGGGTKIIF
jgi:hypothetical protein